jgi:hypothetical protein
VARWRVWRAGHAGTQAAIAFDIGGARYTTSHTESAESRTTCRCCLASPNPFLAHILHKEIVWQ